VEGAFLKSIVIVTNYLRNRLRKLIPAALLLSPALIADFISQTAGNLVCDAARKLWYEGNQAIRITSGAVDLANADATTIPIKRTLRVSRRVFNRLSACGKELKHASKTMVPLL